MCILVIPTSRWLTFVQMESKILTDYMFPYLPMWKALFSAPMSSMANISYLFTWLFQPLTLTCSTWRWRCNSIFETLPQSLIHVCRMIHLSGIEIYLFHPQICTKDSRNNSIGEKQLKFVTYMYATWF